MASQADLQLNLGNVLQEEQEREFWSALTALSAGDPDDPSTTLWDLETGTSEATPDGVPIRFAPDGKTHLCVGSDAKIYACPSGKLVGALHLIREPKLCRKPVALLFAWSRS